MLGVRTALSAHSLLSCLDFFEVAAVALVLIRREEGGKRETEGEKSRHVRAVGLGERLFGIKRQKEIKREKTAKNII